MLCSRIISPEFFDKVVMSSDTESKTRKVFLRNDIEITHQQVKVEIKSFREIHLPHSV